MATVDLHCENDRVTQPMPPVCICCGRPAAHRLQTEFGQMPRWTWAWVGVQGLFAVMCAPVVMFLDVPRPTLTCKADLPVCHRHLNPWYAEYVARFCAIAAMLFFGTAIVSIGQGFQQIDRDGAIVLYVVSALTVITPLIVAKVLGRRSLRAVLVRPDSVTLTNVAPEFAERLQIAPLPEQEI